MLSIGDLMPDGEAPQAIDGTPRRSRPRPTLQDIATAAGVSTGLASLVLRGRSGPSATTAARVIEVADRLGYRANRTASQLASRRTHLLGVTLTPGNPYHGELVEEIQALADAHGYGVVLAAVTRTHDEQRSVEILVDSNCEALVLLGPKLPPETLVQAIGGVPTVCIGRPLDVPAVDVVRSADVKAMKLLVDHLVGLGHTHIAHVDGGDLYLPAERVRGYRRAMKVHGLPPLVIPGGETWVAGTRAGADVMRHSELTAVIAYNDQCAIGLADHFERNGLRVPEDMSVTGFDDDPLAGLAQINLTTINPSQLDQARLAVERAVARAEGDRSQRIIQVAEAHLTIRGSTGPPPAPSTEVQRLTRRN
jgi:DNA-binding LacI/PurR family transcriptional regulator